MLHKLTFFDGKTLALKPDIVAFIKKHLHTDPHTLLLAAKKYPEWDMQAVVAQIRGHHKTKDKLPTWNQTKDIIFPIKLSLEQASSEQTADFKSKLVAGKVLIDMTGGFGVDSFFFAKRFEKVIYVERNEELAHIVQHNFEVLGAKNIEIHHRDALSFLQNLSTEPNNTVIYLDPARRDNAQKKVFLLTDCEPNVLDILPTLFEKATAVLLKTAPMLDIQLAFEQLSCVQKIWIVGLKQECKEVLYLLRKESLQSTDIQPVILEKDNITSIIFDMKKERTIDILYQKPQHYIYEPHPVLLKSGMFKSISHHWQLSKLHHNSQLYTSQTLKTGFMGRAFECKAVLKLDKKTLKKHLPEGQAHIISRNFPLSVAQIRKKTGIKSGGALYLIATTDHQNKKIVLLCERLFL